MSDELTDRQIRELSDALARQAPFVQELGENLLRNGDFTEGIGEHTADHLFNLIRDEIDRCFNGQNEEYHQLLQDHIDNCQLAAAFEAHKDKHRKQECHWGLIALARKHIIKVLIVFFLVSVGGYSITEAIFPRRTKLHQKTAGLEQRIDKLTERTTQLQNKLKELKKNSP